MVEWAWIWGKNGLLIIPCALNLFTQSQIGQLDNCRPPVQGSILECWPQDGRETKVGSFKDRESKRKKKDTCKQMPGTQQYTFLSHTVAESVSSIQNNNRIWTPFPYWSFHWKASQPKARCSNPPLASRCDHVIIFLLVECQPEG